jgi:hypothetical protein
VLEEALSVGFSRVGFVGKRRCRCFDRTVSGGYYVRLHFSSRFNKTIDIRWLFRLKTFSQMTA